MTIRLVTGPPAAGKSSYVRDRARPEDLVVDYDEILAGLGGNRADPEDPRRRAAEMVRMSLEKHLPSDRDAWVIRTLPDPHERHAHAARIGAAEVLVLTAPADELKRRARDAGRPSWTADVIDQWWARYRPHHDDHGPDTGSPDTPTGDTSAMDPQLIALLQQLGHINTVESPEPAASGGSGDDDAQPQEPEGAAKAPKPGPPAAKAAAAAKADEDKAGDDEGTEPAASSGPDLGFPVATPLADMAPEQRAAYWKFQALKHDDEALAAKPAAEREAYWRSVARSAEAANRKPGYVAGLEARVAEADAAELSESDRAVLQQQGKLVRYAMKAHLPAVDAADFDLLYGALNPQALIGEDGDPDEDAIAKIAALLSPKGPRQLHGGPRDPGAGSPAEDARERYNRRFRKNKTSR